MVRALVVLLTALLATAARAGSLETAPTTIELSPQGAAVLHIANRAEYPVAFQVEAFDWTQGPGGERLEPSQVLQASPPMAELAPGQKQVVRLRAVGAAGSERAFRLLVSELPSPQGPQAQQVRVLLQFSVPVFTATAAKGGPALAWRADRDGADLVLTAANTGTRRAKLSGLTVTAGGEAKKPPGGELAYVLAGATRSWRMHLPSPPGEAVTVRAGAEDAPDRIMSMTLDVEE